MKIKSVFSSLSCILIFVCCCIQIASAQIITQQINQTLIGPGQIGLDLNGDNYNEYTFDIISLSIGELAARVHPQGSAQILDNSTFGYPDALDVEDAVSGYFHSNVGVLGTFNDAGQFNGKGNKFLGIKANISGTNLGWIELYCSEDRDTLTLLSFAYVSGQDGAINAGQTVSTATNNLPDSGPGLIFFPNPAADEIQLNGLSNTPANFTVFSSTGELLLKGTTTGKVDISQLNSGVYTICISNEDRLFHKILIISK